MYDITDYNYLFEGNAVTNSAKSQLIEEIAPKEDTTLNVKTIHPEAEKTCIVVDFMSFIRGQVVNFNALNFFELVLIDEIFMRCTKICSHSLILMCI